MRRKISRVYWIIFILLFITPSIIYGFFAKYLDQTNYEQRSAAEKPVFSMESIESFPESYENYFNDTLAFRTQMIKANGLIDFFLFKEPPVDIVVIGSNRWLFYNPNGTDGDPIADMNGTNLFSEEQLVQIANTLLDARNTLQAQEKEFIVLIAPNKESIYGKDYLPAHMVTATNKTRADQVVEYLWENTDLNVVYPKKEILNAIETHPDYDFYYKTDTHWNALGAYIGTRSLLESLDIYIPNLSETTIECTEKCAGDLVTMMGISNFLKYDLYYEVSGYAEEKDVHVSFLEEGNTNNLISLSTTGADARSLFVIRDSYSLAMMPYLSTQFNECHFVHSGSFTPDLLRNYSSDIVVVQVVERYVDHLSKLSLE